MIKYTYLEATAFNRRIQKFRDGIVPGMTLTVYIYTGDQKIDSHPRQARVIHVYPHYCLLEDDKGIKYGPTYHELMEWGN